MTSDAPEQGSLTDSEDLFSCSLVWAPIPLITWLFPVIGHMGICTSSGIVLDFAGPYYVASGHSTIFGRPTRYLRLNPCKAQAPAVDPAGGASLPERQWDTALQAAAHDYQQHMYNIVGDNCHAFCAHFLNKVAYSGASNWNMIHLAAMIAVRGRYVSLWGAAKQWLPFLVFMPVCLYFGTWMFAVAYFGVLFLLIAWFTVYSYVLHST